MSYNKLINFKTKAKFNAQVQNIPRTSIVFIEDTGEIWTHGKFFAKTNGSDHNHDDLYLKLGGGILTGNLTAPKYLSTASGKSIEMFADSTYGKIQTRGGIPLTINPEGNNVGIGTASPSYKLDVAGTFRATGYGLFGNTGTSVSNTNGITIGAGDSSSRYITCYGKTGASYINFGYAASNNNCGELSFNYVGAGSTSNEWRIGFYGGGTGILSSSKAGNLSYSGNIISTGTITGSKIISNVSTGTSPLTVASTTMVTNLNSDMLDGLHSSSFVKRVGRTSDAVDFNNLKEADIREIRTTEVTTTNSPFSGFGVLANLLCGAGNGRMQLAGANTGNKFWFRAQQSAASSPTNATWKEVVLSDGGSYNLNTSSATKLANTRTIWGQSFDGTGNVSGAITGATTGAFSDTLKALRVRAGGTGHFASLHASSVVNEAIFSVFEQSGTEIAYIRIGANKLQFTTPSTGTYNIWHAGNNNIGTGATNYASGNTQITAVSLSASTLTLTRGAGNLTASIPTWNQNTTGNAASATKLITSRTLWGKSFDGTSNISGDMTSVGNINIPNDDRFLTFYGGSRFGKKSGEGLVIETGTNNAVKYSFASNGLYSTSLINLGTSSARWNGIYGNTLSLTGALSGATTGAFSGNVTIGGNLGIGTSSPAYKLDVSGTFRASDDATALSFGISNTSTTSGKGLSLYGGATTGAPTYGMMFAGTATFGTHGDVTSDLATYLTMSNTTNRGWIFRRGSTNVASISGGGKLQCVTLQSNTIATGPISASSITCNSITPIANNMWSLGTTSLNWSNVYTQSLNVSGKITTDSDGVQVEIDSNGLTLYDNEKVVSTLSVKSVGAHIGIMAQGRMTANGSITYKSFNKGIMTGSRLGVGKYRITFPSGWFSSENDIFVTLTGMGYSVGYLTCPIKATLINRQLTYIDVELSDDDTPNEGSFMFQISSLAGW